MLPFPFGVDAAMNPVGFDQLIHGRVRLGIVSALAVEESLTFNELKERLETSDGNLSVHLKTLPTAGARVVQGPGENAGAVDIGDGLAVVFKVESHNHPSAVEPFQGAATGVGEIR